MDMNGHEWTGTNSCNSILQLIQPQSGFHFAQDQHVCESVARGIRPIACHATFTAMNSFPWLESPASLAQSTIQPVILIATQGRCNAVAMPRAPPPIKQALDLCKPRSLAQVPMLCFSPAMPEWFWMARKHRKR